MLHPFCSFPYFWIFNQCVPTSSCMNTYDENNSFDLLQEDAERAFTDLYNQYSSSIFANVLKMVKDPDVAGEIVQDIFITFWRKRAEIRVEKSLEAYLYRMSANKVIAHFRSLQRNKAMLARFTALAMEHYSHIEEGLLYRESQHLLQKAMETLSPQQQKVYQLCKAEGRSYKEAAEMLHISQHTVKEYLVKANLAIRNYMINNIEATIPFIVWFMSKK